MLMGVACVRSLPISERMELIHDQQTQTGYGNLNRIHPIQELHQNSQKLHVSL